MTALKLQNLLIDAFEDDCASFDVAHEREQVETATVVSEDLVNAAREDGRREVRMEFECQMADVGSAIIKLEDAVSAFVTAKAEAAARCAELLKAILSSTFQHSLSRLHAHEATAFIDANLPSGLTENVTIYAGTDLIEALETRFSQLTYVSFIHNPDLRPFQVEIDFENKGAAFDPENALHEILSTLHETILTGDEE